VQTANVVEVSVPTTLRLAGSLKGEQESDLAANASGRVLSTAVERGAEVVPGQLLAKLDVRAAALSAAERARKPRTPGSKSSKVSESASATRSCAKRRRQRSRIRSRSRAMPHAAALAQAAGVRAQLAAQNVGDGTIRAPFAGVVTERYVEVGQYVRQDSRIVTLVSIDPLRLELAVPETNVAEVRQGAAVTFTVAAYPKRTFSGTVRFVSGALRAATRDLVVEALVPNPDAP